MRDPDFDSGVRHKGAVEKGSYREVPAIFRMVEILSRWLSPPCTYLLLDGNPARVSSNFHADLEEILREERTSYNEYYT